MLSRDKALKYFQEREDVEKTALELFCSNDDFTSDCSGYEPCTDFIIQALRNEKTPREIYNTLIDVCKKIGNEFADYVSNGETKDEETKKLKFKTLERLCGVIEVSEPTELEDLTLSTLLPLAIENRRDDFWKKYCYGIICSVSNYPREEHEQMYEELLKEPSFAALSFNKLIELNPNNPRLKEHLKYLWLKHLNDGWECDAPFLAYRYVEETSPEQLRDVLNSIKEDSSSYHKLLDELKKRDLQRGKGNLYEELLSIAQSIN